MKRVLDHSRAMLAQHMWNKQPSSRGRRLDGLRLLGTVFVLVSLSACSREPVEEADMRDFRPVLAHTRQRQAATITAAQIEEAIRQFHLYMGRYPSNLVEVVKAGYVERIPDPPAGMGYLYDPQSGIFRIAPLPSEQVQPR